MKHWVSETLKFAYVGCGCVVMYLYPDLFKTPIPTLLTLAAIVAINYASSPDGPDEYEMMLNAILYHKTSPPPRSHLVITGSGDGPDYERAFAVLSVKLVEISPASRAKLTRVSRATRQIMREASPLPQQSWILSKDEGILYEEPRAWQTHCYAACWYVQAHQYMEPEVQGCPSVAPCARGDGEGLWPPYLERPRDMTCMTLRGGVLGLACSDWPSYIRGSLMKPRETMSPQLWVSLHAPIFSEVNMLSEAAQKAWGRWTAYCEANDVPKVRGRNPQCPFLWIYPWDVLVTICRWAVAQRCPIDWVLAVVEFADGRKAPFERDPGPLGDLEPITRDWLQSNIGIQNMLYDRLRGYCTDYLPLDSVPEKLRGFLRRRFEESWAQDEYADRMQFIQSKQQIFRVLGGGSDCACIS